MAARGKKVELICWCGTHYHARTADIERGWGRSCSKSCAAIKRELGKQNPVYADTGESVKMANEREKP